MNKMGGYGGVIVFGAVIEFNKENNNDEYERLDKLRNDDKKCKIWQPSESEEWFVIINRTMKTQEDLTTDDQPNYYQIPTSNNDLIRELQEFVRINNIPIKKMGWIFFCST